MRRLPFLVALLCSILVVTAHAGWKLQVVTGGGTDEYNLADVDSMTFYADPAPPGFVMVPAGASMMGDGSGSSSVEYQAAPARDFYLGIHEVTNTEFLRALQWAYDNGHVVVVGSIVRDTIDPNNEDLLHVGLSNSQILFDGAGTFYLQESIQGSAQTACPEGYDPTNHPVMNVTWYGAARYCDWLNMQEGLSPVYHSSGQGWVCNGGDPYGSEGYRLPTDAEREYVAQHVDELINNSYTCNPGAYQVIDYYVPDVGFRIARTVSP